MRLFFIFLFILNALFAGWQYYMPKIVNNESVPLPAGLERLVILKESLPAVVEASVDEEEMLSKGTDVNHKPVKTCYTLGPYEDQELVAKIREELGGEVEFTVREREEKDLHRYWVYIPGDKGRDHARKVILKLAKNNIKDYYILQSGDVKNSISLGHFKEKWYADVRVKEISKLGIKPEIEVIYRTYNLYWLDYALSNKPEDLMAKIQEYLVDGVTLLDRQCKAN
ncbi:MAG: hypothetical protein OEZ38_06740 [Gammaproteobacteria bacterium]|nr:hypothetical protein [Gammaproteobacteria bacterium]